MIILARLHALICFFAVGAITFSSCQERKPVVQKAYYPNGKLHVWQEVQNNQLHGRFREYYSTGQLQAACIYVKGKLTGEIRSYYENGKLKSRVQMLEDSLHGPTWVFYRNGAIKERSVYRQGRHTGITFLFDSLTGRKVEHHVYDSTGKMVYTREYDKEGKPAGASLYPITEAHDTVSWGQKYTGYVRFGYPLNSNATMVVGTLGKDFKGIDRYPVVDTFQVVKQSRDGRFYFSFSPLHPGLNAFTYKLIQPGRPWDALPLKDSLSVDNLSVSHPFFVKGAPNSSH